jgi:asparagine synthase (glutamine-hydrolysing)
MRKFFGQVGSMLPEGIKGRNYLIRGSMTVEERFIGNAKIFTEEAKREILSSELLSVGRFDTPQDVTRPIYERTKGYDDVTKMQYVDIHTWLRGDILMKADKMSMANSLELRVPFVDPKVFEFAATIPTKYKIANGTTKYALREAMKDLLPPDVKMRKKLGFPVPIRVWLRDEFYQWAKETIESSQVDAYINKNAVRAMLEMHKEGKGDYSRKLWTILVFMVWHQIFVERHELVAPIDELIAQ